MTRYAPGYKGPKSTGGSGRPRAAINPGRPRTAQPMGPRAGKPAPQGMGPRTAQPMGPRAGKPAPRNLSTIMKKGGKVKNKMAKGGSVKKGCNGVATKGKTKGKMV